MTQFLLGFLMASLLWGGLLFAHTRGVIDVFPMLEPPTEKKDAPSFVKRDPTTLDSPKKSKRKTGRRHAPARRQRQSRAESDLGYAPGEGEVGDDLAAGARSADMNARNEGQLSNADIDAAIDRRFNGIQRCLTLLAPDAPTAGKLVIGMTISNSGEVTRVNLKGPNAMIQGEPGRCFRRIVKAMKLPAFAGPDMIVHYPIVFE